MSDREKREYAVTFNTLQQIAYSLPNGSGDQDILVEARRVLFRDIDPESAMEVLSVASKLRST